MSPFKTLLSGLALSASLAFAAEDAEYDDMGPAAFMWPPDRVWDEAVDNHAPCGSRAAPRNRTDFPMQNGQVALVAQDESWEIQLAIAYNDDPLSNDDFETLIDADHFREMELGHTCVPIENAPSSVNAGDLATLQVKYIADFDTPDNQTFYACADIVWVELSNFDIEIPCFNATVPDDEDGAGPGFDYHGDEDEKDDEDKDEEPSASPSADPSSEEGDDGKKSGNGGGGLAGGAIAGIVVGVVAGLGLIGAGFFIYRRKQQRLQKLRQQNSSRGVEWSQQAAGKGSVSSSSVRMQNM